VYLAYEAGIITGDSDGNFRPQEEVTQHEFVTMVVRLLGFEARVQELGGFPHGYLQVADELRLLQNTTITAATADEVIIRGDIMVLLWNALRVMNKI